MAQLAGRFLARWTLACTTAVASAAALGPTASAERSAACEWEIEYALSANLWLTDTPFGEGDGIYPVGPGRVVLRFEDCDGQPGGRVTLVGHDLQEHFTVSSMTLFWTTTLVTDADSRITVDECGVAAEGALTGTTLAWRTPARGYRTDGTMVCTGFGCGDFGLPPHGRSELHLGPAPLALRPFTFAADMRTFTMPYTPGTRVEMPKHTAHVALGGREVRRACVPARSCRR